MTILPFASNKRENSGAADFKSPTQHRSNDKRDFPLPKYFQVHFEYIHENTAKQRHEVKELKRSVQRIEEKIDRLLSLFNSGEK